MNELQKMNVLCRMFVRECIKVERDELAKFFNERAKENVAVSVFSKKYNTSRSRYDTSILLQVCTKQLQVAL